MNYLIDKAKLILANYPDSNHITFVIKRTTIVCYGVNQRFKTTPLAKRFKYRFSAIHSELSMLKKFPYPVKQIGEYKLVNVRIKKDGSVGMSSPCKICQNLLRYFGVHKIYFTSSGGNFQLLSLN